MDKIKTITKGKLKEEKGALLIEVLIAIMIIGIVGSALIRLQGISAQGTSAALGMTEASFFLSSEIERLMGLRYDDPDLTSGVSHEFVKSSPSNLPFTITYTVADSTSGTYKEVLVTTRWQKNQKNQSINAQFIKLDN